MSVYFSVTNVQLLKWFQLRAICYFFIKMTFKADARAGGDRILEVVPRGGGLFRWVGWNLNIIQQQQQQRQQFFFFFTAAFDDENEKWSAINYYPDSLNIVLRCHCGFI